MRKPIKVGILVALVFCFIGLVMLLLTNQFFKRKTRLVTIEADNVSSLRVTRTWSLDLPIFETSDPAKIEKIASAWNDLQVQTNFDQLPIDPDTALAGGNYDLELFFEDGTQKRYSYAVFDHIVALKPLDSKMFDRISDERCVSGDHLGLIQAVDREDAYLRCLHQVCGWNEASESSR